MSLSLAYRGFDYVSYYNGGYEDADSLGDLAAAGANSAGLNLEYGINVNTSTVYADPNYTDSLTALGNTITEATSLGLTVMVKPLIDFLDPSKIGSNSVGDWRAYYNPTNPAAFFASYKAMIVAEAQVAQAHGATMLSIGTELDQLTGPQYLSYWTDIISSVRAVFSGKLTYSADWNDDTSPWQGHNGLTAGTGNIATQVSFWNQLDYVGLDVYAPLSTAANPTLANLIAGWNQVPTDAETKAVTGNQSLISYFESVAAQTGKPLLFTEIGYESATDAASQPAGSSTNVYDPTLQANLYTAFFDAWKTSGNTALNGVFFWDWDPNTAEVGPGNGANFSPQGLPAESVATTNFNQAIPPVAHNDAFTIAENATLTGHNVFADNGSGADSGSGFTVTAVDNLAAAVGSQITLSSGAHLTLNADGTFAYDPNHAFDSLAAGATASDSFNYAITGGSTAIATVTITGVDNAPVVSGSVTLPAIAENSGAVHITQAELLANASDVDGPSLSAIDLTIASGAGALVDNHDGTWSYTPAPNDDTAVSFSYQVSDGVAAPIADSAALDITPSPPTTPAPPETTPITSTPPETSPTPPVDLWHALGAADVSTPFATGLPSDVVGLGEILWQNDNGQAGLWVVDGTTPTLQTNIGANPGPAWHIEGTGDFNGDRETDILWQNDSGQAGVWLMSGGTPIAETNVGGNPGSAWHVVGAGDIDGDRTSDILWQNDNGQAGVWLMSGATPVAETNVGANPGPSWHLKGAGDFNGDGKADFLWQNDDGQAGVWLMNGTTPIVQTDVGGNPGPSWHIIGTGDFNGDGKADILWQNDNGQAGIWLMDGTTVIAATNIGPNPGPAWHVIGATDFNGDGKSDILWQNDNGQVGVWLMDGTTPTLETNVGANPDLLLH